VLLVVLGFAAIAVGQHLLATPQPVRFGGLFSGRDVAEPAWPKGVQEADAPRLALERWHARARPVLDDAPCAPVPAETVTHRGIRPGGSTRMPGRRPDQAT
jgi:hypothetical protein